MEYLEDEMAREASSSSGCDSSGQRFERLLGQRCMSSSGCHLLGGSCHQGIGDLHWNAYLCAVGPHTSRDPSFHEASALYEFCVEHKVVGTAGYNDIVKFAELGDGNERLRGYEAERPKIFV